MILLLGGTADAAPLACRITETGFSVLLSTVYDFQEKLTGNPLVRYRNGPLDTHLLEELILKESIRAVIDATHPYAVSISETALAVCVSLGIDYIRFLRPSAIATNDPLVEYASDHHEAAAISCKSQSTVLLTIGTRFLGDYVSRAKMTGTRLFARILDAEESVQRCRDLGLSEEQIIAGRGPFTFDQNRKTIRHLSATVLVTKDGGDIGGVREKIDACRAENCKVIVVSRPVYQGDSCATYEEVVKRLFASTRNPL